MIIPKLAIKPIVTATGKHSFDYALNGVGAWVTVTITDTSWGGGTAVGPIESIGGMSPAGGDSDCEEAIEASTGGAFTFDLGTTGANRGKFVWTKDAAPTYKIRANGTDVLLNMLGFTSPSGAYAATITGNKPSPYVFIPEYPLRDSETFPWEAGSDWERISARSVQTVAASGRRSTIASIYTDKVRTITFQAMSAADREWFAEFWELARDGTSVRFWQDITNTTAYDKWSNPMGYYDIVFADESINDIQTRRTHTSTPGYHDVTIKIALDV